MGLEHCAIAKPIYVAIEDDFMDTAARQIFRIMSADARFGDITIKIENAKAEYANSLAEAKASLTA